MVEQEEVMKNKKSLLVKYEIPLEHISIEYVEKCNDRKEIEKIVKILRSGEEGHFPQLLQCAETRLRQVAPESRVLQTEEPILTKSMLEPEHWNKVSNDIREWAGEMKTREHELKESSSIHQSLKGLPAVRNVENSKTQNYHNEKQEAGTSRVKSVVPRNYADWDKFDVDTELLKMELEDERRKEQAMKKKKQQEKEKKKNKKDEEDKFTYAIDNLSATEKEFMATQEKDRGNEYYRCGDFELALKHYTSSILLYPTPTAYNNRAMAYLKLHKFGAALADCNQVLEAQPLNIKALLRRGIAHQNKNNYEQAFKDFCHVVELEPDNRLAMSLSEQMKTKCGNNLKSVRMTIEDKSSGFVIPSPRPNIAVNEWGLAKTMCKCSGTPAWSCRIPPKCRICQRKRAERRTKKEEDRLKLIEVTEETSEFSEGNNSIVVKVTTDDDDDDDDDRAGRSIENSNNDQMQVDEKGSGDVWATEKIVEQVGTEDLELPHLNNLISSELEERKENGNLRDEKGLVESVAEANTLKDGKERTFTNSDNVAMEVEERGDLESNREVKQKLPLCNNITMAIETKEGWDTNQVNVGNTSLNASKLKNEKVSVDNNSNETELMEGSVDKKTSSEANRLISTHQQVSRSIGKEDVMPTKVKVANKYKVNVNTSWEVSTKCTTKQESFMQVKRLNISTSPYEFMKMWQSLKRDTDLSAHAELLLAVPPPDLQSVLGNKLDGTMLSTILLCLDKHFAPELVLEYLENLIMLPRFNIVSLFLESSEKQAVHRLLQRLESLGHQPTVALKKAFLC